MTNWMNGFMEGWIVDGNSSPINPLIHQSNNSIFYGSMYLTQEGVKLKKLTRRARFQTI